MGQLGYGRHRRVCWTISSVPPALCRPTAPTRCWSYSAPRHTSAEADQCLLFFIANPTSCPLGKNFFKRIGALFTDAEAEEDFVRFHSWARSVGEGFLLPFGEDIKGDGEEARVHLQVAYAMAGPETEKRAAEASGVTKVLTACQDPEMPYPIIIGAVVVPEDDLQFVAYEWTPQYSGVPVLLTSPQAAEAGLVQVKGLPEGTTVLGGVLIEPIGANSDAPEHALPASNGPPALMDLNRAWNVPLAQAAGISSAFVAQHVPSQKISDYTGAIKLHVISADGSGALMGFADGGGVDNTGVHAALRRGVAKLLVCNANGVALPEKGDKGDKGDKELLKADKELLKATFAKAVSKQFSDLSSLFGAYPDDEPVNFGRKRSQLKDGETVSDNEIPGDKWNSYMQVLGKEKWDEVVDQMFDWSASNPEGKPLMCHVKDVDVVSNGYQGVCSRGEKVEIIFLFNSMPEKWKEMVDKVDDGVEGNFKESHATENLFSFMADSTFPYIATTKLTYDPNLVGYLSNLSAYNMRQILPEVRQLIGRDGGK